MSDTVSSNPFYISLSCNNGTELNFNELKIEFKYVYFIAKYENKNVDIDIFYKSDSIVNYLSKQNVILYQIPFSMINYIKLKKNLIIVDKVHLDLFNKFNYSLNDRELVFLMVDCDYKLIQQWYSTINCNNIDDYLKMKIFTNYYGLSDSSNIDNLLFLLQKLSNSDYWKNEKNLNLSIADKFSMRRFNIKFKTEWNLDTNTFNEKFNELLKQLPQDQSYSFIDKIGNTSIKNNIVNKKNDFIKSFYDITNNFNEINENEVENLICSSLTSEKEKLMISCILLISKDYFHIILKNINIMNRLKDIIEKYKPLYRYVLSYAWQCLAQEEKICKTNITQESRHVFTLEQASILPKFYFNHNDARKHPYYSLNVGENTYQSDNLHGVEFPYDYQQGIVDIETFKHRLNLFTCGNETVDLYENVDWNICAVTGGCMAALLPKINPLMGLPAPINKDVSITVDKINTFFDKFYSESDIDVVFTEMSQEKYMTSVNNFVNTLKLNIRNKLNKNDEIKLSGHKNLHIYINKNILFSKCKKNEIPFTFDFISKNLYDSKVKFYFYQKYISQKNLNVTSNNFYSDIEQNDLYIKFLLPAVYDDMSLILSDSDLNWNDVFKSNIDHIYENNVIFMRFNETLKFKITSPHIKHKIEIFKINRNSCVACVSHFHLPCVRSCYNGKTCYLLPSAITAYNCLTNIDFKYFCGTNDPLTILTKYRHRGYGTMLNKNEIIQYFTNVLIDKNNRYNLTEKSECNDIIGTLPINSNFFCSTKSLDVVKANKNTYKKSVIDWYNSKYPNFPEQLLFNIIKDDGNLHPVKKWLIDASFDLLC